MNQARGFAQQLSNSALDKARNGDVQALDSIYRTFSRSVYTLAYRIIGSHSLAQDVTHDVFLKVFNKLSELRADSSVGSWIKKITANESINRIRAERKIMYLGEQDFVSEGCSDLFDEKWMINQRDLESSLLKLDENYRAVLILHQVEGFRHSEIAEMYGKSESFSKVTLLRALKVLKESMAD